MILQTIDNKTYINGIESPIEDMPEDKIEERLIDIKKQVLKFMKYLLKEEKDGIQNILVT